VKVAEMIGYQRVVDLARQMGLGNNIQATPAVALGAYEMTPIDVAAGYTAFATNGTRAEPLFIRSVVASDGSVEEQNNPQTRPVIDPRVAFLTTSLMEDVINHGTGVSVRYLGFNAPAAGKTGTSRDGWFAGFTSNLLCVVWIGFDDNRDLGLSGSATAAPLWGEFMKRAVLVPAYRNAQGFDPPPGVIQEIIDPETGQLATPQCPKTQTEYFVAGSEPNQFCQIHGGAEAAESTPGSWLSHLFGRGSNPAPPPPGGANGQANASNLSPRTKAGQQGKPADQSENPPEPEKKKGLLDKIFGIFGGSKKPSDKPGKDKDQP
jgi:penicillin-binding protein 1B